MQDPALQTVPKVHAEHIAPERPHADELEPSSHMPFAEQHPDAQVVALHAGGGGVHASHIEGNASESSARRIRFMEGPLGKDRNSSSRSLDAKNFSGPLADCRQ